MEVGISSLNLIVLILAIEDVGIWRTGNLDQRGRRMHLFGVPNRGIADKGDVRADEFLGAEDPALNLVGIPRKHHVFIQKRAGANVSRNENTEEYGYFMWSYLISRAISIFTELGISRNISSCMVITFKEFQCPS